MSAHYTPQPEQNTPPDATTPTRHANLADFTSPSAYINHDAYTPTDSQPNAGMPMNDYDFTYTDFSEFIPQTAPGMDDLHGDQSTPVVSDMQYRVPFPTHPNYHGDETIRAAHMNAQPRRPLLSPFRTGQPPQEAQPYPLLATGQLYYPPYPPIPQQPVPQAFIPPQYVSFQHPMQGYHSAAPIQPSPTDFTIPRSRNGSPTSSISSSAVSLTRSASTSSELRPSRPKVKLTWEDKRSIVELHRSNSSLRQEDIARQYGVDRSTISKIILAAHRWTQPQEIHVPPVPKVAKAVGGRFPAVEAKMDQWMDEQIALGLDVRDQVARDKAKEFAKEIGFPVERFKASAKWLDKFKDRRKLAGKPVTSPVTAFGYYPYTTAPYTDMGHSLISRSHSAVTLSSSDSSGQEMYMQQPVVDHVALTRSETDLLHVDTTPSRQRSQSSPHLLGEPGTMSPSSGRASRIVRPSPLHLQRQNSYHGQTPSPRRPTGLTRANSTQGGGILRRNRPTSLAASAFGITPIIGEDVISPLHSPLTSASSSGTHSRQRSDASLTPFTSSMGGMTISPDMEELNQAPLTPITPGQSVGAVFPASQEYAPMDPNMAYPMPVYQGQYATMPNKHYGHVHHQYTVIPASDFGPIPTDMQNQQWRH